MSTLGDLFKLLDADESGSVGIEEFCEFLIKVVATDEPFYALEMKRNLEGLQHVVRASLGEVGGIIAMMCPY